MIVMCLVTLLRFNRWSFQLQSVTEIIADGGPFGRIAISECFGIRRDTRPVYLIGLNVLWSLLPARPVQGAKAEERREAMGGGHFHLLFHPSAPTEGLCLPFPGWCLGRPDAADFRKGGLWPHGPKGCPLLLTLLQKGRGSSRVPPPWMLCLVSRLPGSSPGRLWVLTLHAALR